ncbi:MAG: hypothetical protein PHN37_00655 [Candidatus Pacebacteria bacterium]|nr:hypothetical protein [Candidatus Paceibacterota bacterium]
MPEIILNISNILLYILNYIRIIAIILSFLMIIAIIIFNLKTVWLRDAFLETTVEFFKHKPYEVQKFLKQWKTISSRLKTGNEQAYKLAIIEADNLLEEVLEKMKFKGETTKERIANIPKTILEDIKDIEQAHQIRDNIVHDPDYQINLEEAKRVLLIYERVIKQLT